MYTYAYVYLDAYMHVYVYVYVYVHVYVCVGVRVRLCVCVCVCVCGRGCMWVCRFGGGGLRYKNGPIQPWIIIVYARAGGYSYHHIPHSLDGAGGTCTASPVAQACSSGSSAAAMWVLALTSNSRTDDRSDGARGARVCGVNGCKTL